MSTPFLNDLGDEPPRGHAPPPWIMTFADLMVLLMCFFVLMLSFSEMDAARFKLMAGSMQEAFGVQREVRADEAPTGTSTETADFAPGTPDATTVDEVRQHTTESSLATLDRGLELRMRELQAQEQRAEDQAENLRSVFRQEIADGRLVVRRDGTSVVIQLLEKDSFASGRAELEAASLEALAKVGELVAGMKGAIAVSGHTDNVPVRAGGPYRSNWDLSAARAASVAHELLRAGIDPARLMVSGHADTQPRVPNDTPQQRAQNRRVDITFVNGRERHGGWTDAEPRDALPVADPAEPVVALAPTAEPAPAAAAPSAAETPAPAGTPAPPATSRAAADGGVPQP